MTVLFHFSLSLSNYEYRRRRTVNRNQPLPPSADTESLIRNQQADDSASSSSYQDSTSTEVYIPKKNFFKSPLLYQNALLYVFSRLFLTTSLVYMPLWLNERAYMPNMTTTGPEVLAIDLTDGQSVENIATVPLASFIASFLSSMLFKMSVRFTGHQVGYFIGSVISLLGCGWVAYAATPDSPVYELYLVATLFGAGSSITMIASLCITADMIGPHADQGGFIYSAVTFCDKLITGVAVVIIETM
jgi:MFS family permease